MSTSAFKVDFCAYAITCADLESYFRGGPNLITFFCFVLVDKGEEDTNTAINGPSSARQRNAMAFRWRAVDGPSLNAGLVALWFFRGSGPVLQRNPIFL